MTQLWATIQFPSHNRKCHFSKYDYFKITNLNSKNMNSFLTFVKCEDAFLEGEQNMDPETRRKQYMWGFLPPSCPEDQAGDMLTCWARFVKLYNQWRESLFSTQCVPASNSFIGIKSERISFLFLSFLSLSIFTLKLWNKMEVSQSLFEPVKFA